MIVSIVGLGETGGALARILVKNGIHVKGFDSHKVAIPDVELCADIRSAVENSDLIFSINSSTVATKVLTDAIPAMKSDALFIDLNTTSPALKRKLEMLLGDSRFIDGVLELPRHGVRDQISIMVSGPTASKFVETMGAHGIKVEIVGEKVGEVSTRELIRRMFLNGLSMVLIDSLWAAEALGLEDWAIKEFRQEFELGSSQTLQILLDQAQNHAKSAQVTMSDIVSMLSEFDYESLMTAPSELLLSHIIHAKKVPFSQPDN